MSMAMALQKAGLISEKKAYIEEQILPLLQERRFLVKSNKASEIPIVRIKKNRDRIIKINDRIGRLNAELSRL